MTELGFEPRAPPSEAHVLNSLAILLLQSPSIVFYRFWELLYSPCQTACQPLLAYFQWQRAHYRTSLQSKSLGGWVLVPIPASSFSFLDSAILWLPHSSPWVLFPRNDPSYPVPQVQRAGWDGGDIFIMDSFSLSSSPLHFLCHHSLFLWRGGETVMLSFGSNSTNIKYTYPVTRPSLSLHTCPRRMGGEAQSGGVCDGETLETLSVHW